MKKIAFIFTAYIKKYDGVSVYIENLFMEFLKLLKNKNRVIQIDVYLREDLSKFFQNRINYKYFGLHNVNFVEVPGKGFLSRLFYLHLYLFKNQYDLIFIPNAIPLLVKGKKFSVIHDISSDIEPKYFSLTEKYFGKYLIKHVIKSNIAIGYISKSTKRDLENIYQIHQKSKIFIYLPNGIPFKVKELNRPNIEYVFNKYINKNLKLIFVGRLNRHKGLDRLIKLAKFLEYKQDKFNNNFFESIEFHIVGKKTEETIEIIKNFYPKNIKLNFHGYLSDEELNKLYKESHFCFFLSRNEGYGLPLVEALWLRTIPILSDIPIFREIMGDDYPLFKEDNIEEDIYSFIKKIFENENYKKEILSKMEKIVEKEKDGYKIAALNMINFIEKFLQMEE